MKELRGGVDSSNEGTRDVTENHQAAHQERHTLPRWVMVLALIYLISSLSCSLGRRLGELQVLAVGSQEDAGARRLALATRTPWPTFTPTIQPSPTATPTFTPSPTLTPTASATPISTPLPTPTWLPTATVTLTPVPSVTPRPAPARPPATSTLAPSATAAPGYAYLINEVYRDRTTNPFLTGYVAIVNAQEIPIGGVKAVGSFDPGGARFETSLSKWFFEGYSAPGPVIKSSSVKFEPPGSIQPGAWTIHLEDEHGTRLSEDVSIATDPDNPEWFFVKFKQPGKPALAVRVPTPTISVGAAAVTPVGGSPTTTAGGWSFVNVQRFDSGVVYGEAVNDSGSSQQISHVTGTFYDSQGQVVAGTGDISDYWPIYIVPPGAVVPFKLSISGAPGVADLDLSVISQPSSDTPRQDFAFSDADASQGGGGYCVTGSLQNPGGSLQDYLTIVAVLYNAQGNVINFESYDEFFPEDVVGDQTLDFEVCVDPLNQEVARYELRAWGE
jgi:hypothetical protein